MVDIQNKPWYKINRILFHYRIIVLNRAPQICPTEQVQSSKLPDFHGIIYTSKPMSPKSSCSHATYRSFGQAGLQVFQEIIKSLDTCNKDTVKKLLAE